MGTDEIQEHKLKDADLETKLASLEQAYEALNGLTGMWHNEAMRNERKYYRVVRIQPALLLYYFFIGFMLAVVIFVCMRTDISVNMLTLDKDKRKDEKGNT